MLTAGLNCRIMLLVCQEGLVSAPAPAIPGEAGVEAAVLVTASAFLKLLNRLVGLQWWEEWGGQETSHQPEHTTSCPAPAPRLGDRRWRWAAPLRPRLARWSQSTLSAPALGEISTVWEPGISQTTQRYREIQLLLHTFIIIKQKASHIYWSKN